MNCIVIGYNITEAMLFLLNSPPDDLCQAMPEMHYAVLPGTRKLLRQYRPATEDNGRHRASQAPVSLP